MNSGLLSGGMPREIKKNATLRRMDGWLRGNDGTMVLVDNGIQGENKVSSAVRHGIGRDPSFSPWLAGRKKTVRKGWIIWQ